MNEPRYGNVRDRFIPANLPDVIFANDAVNHLHNVEKLNLAEALLADPVRDHDWADRVAIDVVTVSGGDVRTDESVTYGEILEASQRFARGLETLGVEPGERVLWRFGNEVEALTTTYATWQLGAVTVPSYVIEGPRELDFFIEDTEASTVITTNRRLADVTSVIAKAESVHRVIVVGGPDEPPVQGGPTFHRFRDVIESKRLFDYYETDPMDVSSICYTGGTSGQPKGCVRAHAEEFASFETGRIEERALGPDDVTFCPMPIGHGAGRDNQLVALRAGARTLIAPDIDPADIPAVIEAYGVTTFTGVGSLVRMIMKQSDVERYDLSSLRLCRIPALSEEEYDTWHGLTGIEPTNAFGMVPLGWFTSAYRTNGAIAPRGSLGKPYPGYELKLVDIDDPSRTVDRGERGRPAVRGPMGVVYWHNQHPDIETRQREDVRDGWSLVDDIWRLDEDGQFWYLNRLDDMITTGGRQVAPGEVEAVIDEHPRIAEVAVVGKPHPDRGEIVYAFCVPRGPVDDEAALVGEIQEFVKARISLYKYPRSVELVDTLPTDSVGKIQYGELRDRAREASDENDPR